MDVEPDIIRHRHHLLVTVTNVALARRFSANATSRVTVKIFGAERLHSVKVLVLPGIRQLSHPTGVTAASASPVTKYTANASVAVLRHVYRKLSYSIVMVFY